MDICLSIDSHICCRDEKKESIEVLESSLKIIYAQAKRF